MAPAEHRRHAGRRSEGGVRLADVVKERAAGARSSMLQTFPSRGEWMRNIGILGLLVLIAGCRTVGGATTEGGFAEISPNIAAETTPDSPPVAVVGVPPATAYRGPQG